MAAAQNLIGIGLPPAAAARLGFTASTKTGVGTAQAGAAALTGNLTTLTTSGGATAFVLPAAIAGAGPIIVWNPSATTALIYPPSGGAIQGGSTDAAFSVAQNKTAAFFKVSATAWAALLTA